MILRRTFLRAGVGGVAGVVVNAGAIGACAKGPPSALPSPPAPRAPGVIQLALNESPFGPSPAAIRAIEAELGTLGRYTADEAAALTQQISLIEGVSAEEVVLGEVLEPLGALLVEDRRGAEVVYSTPGYTALADAARGAGGAAIGVPLDARLENDLHALHARITAATRALFVVNPHNPSGTASEPAAFHAFVSEAASRTLVIVDEAYLEYTGDFAGRTCASHVRAGQNVAVFRTFSKIHGLAALPFGYAILPSELAATLKKRGVGQARSLNRLAVVAAGASLRDTSFVSSVRARVAVERERWFEALDALSLRRADARGNFVFFETGRPHADVAAAMRARGVDIGRAFPPLERWARISIGLPDENAQAQRALRESLRG